MANSVDPDQMLHSVASDLGLLFLQRPICLNTYDYFGIWTFVLEKREPTLIRLFLNPDQTAP